MEVIFIYRNNINRKAKENIQYEAIAQVEGNLEYKNIKGYVKFYPHQFGTIITLELQGLPNNNRNNFFGFHIHQLGECKQEKGREAFNSAGAHFDLEKNAHPNHSGDLPSIYSNNGYSYMQFFTNRFRVSDVIGKSVIIHQKEDDLKTQPSGNSGTRIACGLIKNI